MAGGAAGAAWLWCRLSTCKNYGAVAGRQVWQMCNGLPGQAKTQRFARPSKNATAKKEIEPSEIEPSEIEPSEIEPSCFPTYQKTVRVAQGDLVRDASGTLRVRDRRDFLVW